MKNYPIDVDIKRNMPYTGHTLVQNDSNSNQLDIDVYDNSLPYNFTGLTPKILFVKHDGTEVFEDLKIEGKATGITVVDASKGQLNVLLSAQTLSAAGMVKGEIQFYGASGEKETSGVFQFYVRPSLDSGNAIPSSNELTALINALMQVEDITGTEAARAAAEQARVEAENQRVAEYNNIKQINTELTEIATVAAANNKYSLDLSQYRNFKVETSDTVAKIIEFLNVPSGSKIISLSVYLINTNLASFTYPAGVVWQDGIVPYLNPGKKYILFFQSYDSGANWLGSYIGEW